MVDQESMNRQGGKFAGAPPRPLAPSPILYVAMGEGIVARAPHVICSDGFGSCVAVILYDRKRKIGGLAHIMLPAAPQMQNADCGVSTTRNSQLETRNAQFKYADTAITALLEEIQSRGGLRCDIVAKMAGGARMFTSCEDTGPGIGQQNIAAVRESLDRKRIWLIGEDVGGHHGRGVEFHLESGKVIAITVTTRGKEI